MSSRGVPRFWVLHQSLCVAWAVMCPEVWTPARLVLCVPLGRRGCRLWPGGRTCVPHQCRVWNHRPEGAWETTWACCPFMDSSNDGFHYSPSVSGLLRAGCNSGLLAPRANRRNPHTCDAYILVEETNHQQVCQVDRGNISKIKQEMGCG